MQLILRGIIGFGSDGGSPPTHGVPLKVGVELVRYERATNEACARRLATRYLESPLTAKEIVVLPKRDEKRGRGGDEQSRQEASSRAPMSVRALARFEAELAKDRERALGELATFVERLGTGRGLELRDLQPS